MLPSLLLPHLHQQTQRKGGRGRVVGVRDLPSLGTARGVCPGSGELHTEIMELWNGLCWQRAQSAFTAPCQGQRHLPGCPECVFPRGEHPGCSGKMELFNPEGQQLRCRAGSGAAPAPRIPPQSHGSPLRGALGLEMLPKIAGTRERSGCFSERNPTPSLPLHGHGATGGGLFWGEQREKGDRSDWV